MIISVWRYSHLALAVSSFLLLTLASLTGIVLAFEPVMEKAKGYKMDGFEKVTLAQALPQVKKKLPGIQELTIDENDFAVAKYSDEDGKDKIAYINPATGEVLGAPQKQAPLFEWMTALHRSLFLHETGRLIVGITSFLLLLIVLSGIALVIQRQRGVKRFFSPIEKTSFAQYYHVAFGRLTLLFIVAVAVSGAYLSVSRFIIKPEKVTAKVPDDAVIREEPQQEINNFTLFRQTKLSQVQVVQFPFSEFPEDYYTLKLDDRELCVNQLTGDILAQQVYPSTQTLASFSLRWHTGRSNVVWAIVLAITAGYILFFIYSGLFIAWRRMRSKPKNKYKAAACRIIILAGSENGSTYRFAGAVYKQLLKHGEKAYLTDLDNYTLFPKAEHLVIMTSTYGEGDPPSNAKKFAARLLHYPQQQPVHFSVVGFGSRSYQQFCGFAYSVHQLLQQQSWAVPQMEVVTVDDKSPQDFSTWLTAWTQRAGFTVTMPRELLAPAVENLKELSVTHKTEIGSDDAFLIRLKATRNNKIASGDLLAVYPKNDHRERLYSIGKVDGEVQLSVKLHAHGLGSPFLAALRPGQSIRARVIKNRHFHFPEKAKQVIMICNGTGIAPFLGMISENKKGVACTLYCGFRTGSSFQLYEPFLVASVASGKLKAFHKALSREGDKEYVSHRVVREATFIWDVLSSGGVLMICGSLSMQKDVLAVLDEICRQKDNSGIEAYQHKGQLLMDCY